MDDYHPTGLDEPLEIRTGHGAEGHRGQLIMLTFDPDAYRSYLKDCGLSAMQEREVLEAVWLVVVSFVDLGFNLSPIQQVLEEGTTERKTLDGDSTAALRLDNSHIETTNTLAAQRPDGRAEPKG